jgi:hypothetical protein
MSSPHPRHPASPQIVSKHPRHRGRQEASVSFFVVTIHIPLQYNANVRGIRKPVEQSKIRETLLEAQSYFSGFSILGAIGWCRSQEKDGTWDDHLRIEVDVRWKPQGMQRLLRWKQTLKQRFAQTEIYVRVTGPARWI